MSNKTHRKNHIFREDKKKFIMAMDNGNMLNVLNAMKYHYQNSYSNVMILPSSLYISPSIP